MKRNKRSPYRSRGMTLGSRGMTLLEVLVALAIFATAAISVIRAVTQHINTLSYLEEKTFAAMVVDNQMALVMLHPEKLKKRRAHKSWPRESGFGRSRQSILAMIY